MGNGRCTVSLFAGREFDYVVLSTCRSVSRSEVEKMPTDDWLQRHLGVTADFHQINTALTRVKNGLIITGESCPVSQQECVCVGGCVCVCACVRACIGVCMCVCVCVWTFTHTCLICLVW